METLVPAAICRHSRIRVATKQAMEFIHLTVQIGASVAEAGSRHDPNARILPLTTGERPDGHAHCENLLLESLASQHSGQGVR